MNAKGPIEVKKRIAILFAISVALLNIDGKSQEPLRAKDRPKAVPARALAIEKKFDVVFYEAGITYTMFSHIKYETWLFVKQMPKNFITTLGVSVPAYATDETMEKCLTTALGCAGWQQGAMEFEIAKRKMVPPTELTVPVPSPPPLTDHT